MGETLPPFTTGFNKSLRVESRAERLTGDAGAVVLREILERSGIVEWMAPRLVDPRRQEDVVHDLPGVRQGSCRLHSISRCAGGGPGHGVAAAGFMGERVGGPMASAPGVGPLGVEPDRADGMPVARAA